eukprot:PhF_6_TR5079/c0_g1_i1/m.7121
MHRFVSCRFRRNIFANCVFSCPIRMTGNHHHRHAQPHNNLSTTLSTTAPSRGLRRSDIYNDETSTDLTPKPKRKTAVGECDLCGEKFQNDLLLLYHANEVHLAVKCDYTQDERWVYPVDTMFQCSVCNKTFTVLDGLLGHYQQKHPKQIPQHKSDVLAFLAVKCKTCSKLFANNQLLEQHMYSDHGVVTELKPYKCEDCPGPLGKDFADPIVLLTHILTTHGEERDKGNAKTGIFDCYFCEKVSNTLSSFAAHIAAKHPKVGVTHNADVFRKCFGAEGFQIYSCGKGCGRKFITKRHQDLHHKKGCGKTAIGT